jgi:hypothetical protein
MLLREQAIGFKVLQYPSARFFLPNYATPATFGLIKKLKFLAHVKRTF